MRAFNKIAVTAVAIASIIVSPAFGATLIVGDDGTVYNGSVTGYGGGILHVDFADGECWGYSMDGENFSDSPSCYADAGSEVLSVSTGDWMYLGTCYGYYYNGSSWVDNPWYGIETYQNTGGQYIFGNTESWDFQEWMMNCA